MSEGFGDDFYGHIGSLEDGGVGMSGEIAGRQFGKLELLPDTLHMLVDRLDGLVDVPGFLCR